MDGNNNYAKTFQAFLIVIIYTHYKPQYNHYEIHENNFLYKIYVYITLVK